jgi:hypothetical protein
MRQKLTAFVLSFLGCSAPCFATPWIHEVFYDAEGADAASVFTELAGLPGMALEGYRLVGIDGATGAVYRQIELTGASIPADGLLVIATSRALGELVQVRDFTADVDWQNGPDAIQIRDALGGIVDALQYGDAGARFLGEGPFAPDGPPGFSLTRDLLGTDTGDNGADFAIVAPTPGAGRSLAAAPEPPSWFLFFPALLAVAGYRRSPIGAAAWAGAFRLSRPEG